MTFFDTADLRDGEIFLKLVQTTEAVPEKRWVPVYKFRICLAADGTDVGQCDFRVGNTEKLYFGGNIGYGIDEAYRGRHYAAKACRLLMNLARRHGMRYLHITCDHQNYASRRTCEVAGGTLETILDLPTDNDMYQAGQRRTCVYRFSL